MSHSAVKKPLVSIEGRAGLRVFASFGISSAALAGANLVNGLVVLRWIPPHLMAVWQTLLLTQGLCDIVKFGTLNGMNREFPFLLGKGEIQKAHSVVATALSYLHISQILGLIILTGVTVSNWSDGLAWRIGGAVAAVQWASNYYNTYVQATYRGGDQFSKLAKTQWLEVAISLALLPVVAWWSFTGFCFKTLIQCGIMTCVLYAGRPIKVRAKFDFGLYRELLKSGLPLFASSYVLTLALNAERAALLAGSDPGRLGFLAPVLAIQSAVLILPNAVSTFLYPKLAFTFGKNADPRCLWGRSIRATLCGVLAAAILALCGYLFIGLYWDALFPSYRESLSAARWALASGIFLAFRPLASVLPVLRSWGFHYLWISVFAGTKWISCWIMAKGSEDPLQGVAQAGCLASAIAAVSILACVYKATRKTINSEPVPATRAKSL